MTDDVFAHFTGEPSADSHMKVCTLVVLAKYDRETRAELFRRYDGRVQQWARGASSHLVLHPVSTPSVLIAARVGMQEALAKFDPANPSHGWFDDWVRHIVCYYAEKEAMRLSSLRCHEGMLQALHDDDVREFAIFWADSPPRWSLGSVSGRLLKAHLQTRPPSDRRILVLKFVCRMTDQAIADELGTTKQHVEQEAIRAIESGGAMPCPMHYGLAGWNTDVGTVIPIRQRNRSMAASRS